MNQDCYRELSEEEKNKKKSARDLNWNITEKNKEKTKEYEKPSRENNN